MCRHWADDGSPALPGPADLVVVTPKNWKKCLLLDRSRVVDRAISRNRPGTLGLRM